MSEKIRVLVIEPGKNPEEREIDNDLKTMQELVGGFIEAVPMKFRYADTEETDRVDLICNEEGKIFDMPRNRYIPELNYDVVCGTFFLAGVGGEDFTSLTEDQIKRLKRKFTIWEDEEE